MATRREKEAGPMEVWTVLELDLREHSFRALKGDDALPLERNSVFFQLSHCIRTDFGPVATRHNIRHPVFHHDGKIRTFIALAVCSHGFPCIFKAIAV